MDNLVFQIQQDSEYAFKQLYQIYYAKVVSFITGIIKERDIAKDLAQDIFINLWLNRKKLDISKNIQNYIFVASRNAAINYLKKELAFSHGTIEAIQADVRTSDTAEDNLFAKEISLLIEMVVSEMPQQRQLIYRLSKEQGLSNEEIASKLGISKRSVENQISMALKEIKRAISFTLYFYYVCYHELNFRTLM